MNTLDIEDRLRRTYADVAEHTVTVPGPDVTIVPLGGAVKPARRRSMVVAAAAVATLVIGAAVVIDRTGPSAPAGIDPTTLVHVLPSGLEMSANTPPLPLVRLETTAERDIIEYAGDGDRLRIQVDRGDAVQPVANPDTTIDGMSARLDVDAGVRRITWNPRPQVQVTVDWDRGPVPLLLDVADQLIFVDEDAWRRATEHAGFGPSSTDDPRPGVVAEYRLATTVPVTVQVQGSLHSSFSIRFSQSPAIPNLRQRCTATTGLVGGPPGRVAIIADEAGRATVRRSGDGGVVARVDIAVAIPGTANLIEVIDLGDPGGDPNPWACEVDR